MSIKQEKKEKSDKTETSEKKPQSVKLLIARALSEARTSVLEIVLFHSALDVIVAFSLMSLGCLLLGLSYWYAFAACAVYAIIHTAGQLRKVNYRTIEAKTPELEEQLITVADNYKQDNEIVNDLNQEVLKKMKDVRSGDFLSFGRVTRELLVIAVVSFIIIGTSAFNVHFLDVKSMIDEVKNFRQNQDYAVNEDLLEYEELQNLSEILGEETIAELGKQQIDLELNPLMSDVDIGTVKPPEERQFREVAPPQIKATNDQSFEDNIPKEYQRIVKTYFKEITTS